MISRRTILCSTVALVAPTIAPNMAFSQSTNRYIHANNSTYDTLDPHATLDIARLGYKINFYDGLYRWADNPPKLIPWLAKSHEVSADGLTWTFHLRDDVKFQDGTPMTADDVVYSMERILAVRKGPGQLFMPLLDPGSSMAVDKHTVTFKLKKPAATFGSIVPELWVVNSAVVKQHEVDGDWGQKWMVNNVASSGSFMLENYAPTVGFLGKRNADHFAGWGEKYFDEIEYRTVTETNTRVQGLIRGDYHGVDGYLPVDQISRLREAQNVNIIEQETMRVFYLGFHNARPPFDDINFRKAVAHAFDYDGYIQGVKSGTVARNATIMPNNMWSAPKDIPGVTYDLEKAKEYLAKVKGPIRKIRLGAYAGFSETEQAAAVMQNGLSQLGIESAIEVTTWPIFQSNMYDFDKAVDISPMFRSTTYADPHNWIGYLYGSAAPADNSSFYRNEKVFKLLDQGLATSDQAERSKIYEAAVRQVYDDVAGIWIYNTKWFGPYSNKIGGIRFSPVYGGEDVRWAHFVD